MDKHPTENPAGKAIHHFKVVGLLALCCDFLGLGLGRGALLPDVVRQGLVDSFLAVLGAGGVIPEPFDNVIVQLESYLLIHRLVERSTDGFGPVD